MNHLKFISLIPLATLSFYGCGGVDINSSRSSLEEHWNHPNNPSLLKDNNEVHFAKLPVEGVLADKPWTDSYWPSSQGGIAARWNDSESNSGFTYETATRAEIAAMSSDELKKLSPAEKYDILHGRFDFPLVKAERQRTRPTDPGWFGLCHGWAAAAINFDEPKPVTLKNPDGIDVPFGSSDVKALITFSQARVPGLNMVGQRCNLEIGGQPDRGEEPQCRDTNAGSFHIIVTNRLGLLKQAFIADLSRDLYVWNHPVFGFKSSTTGESTEIYPTAAPGTVRVVHVETILNYTSELGADWQPKPFADFPYQASERLFSYTVELDAAGDIIGGEWRGHDRPDFVWTQEAAKFTGYLAGVKAIYEASVAEAY